jgi:hypothetical protein
MQVLIDDVTRMLRIAAEVADGGSRDRVVECAWCRRTYTLTSGRALQLG